MAGMDCQTLDALQSPGLLARTLRALGHPRPAPLAFAFQAFNPQVAWHGTTDSAPPVLLLASPGRVVSGALLRRLRVPAADAEPFRSGRPIRGKVFWLRGHSVLATRQRVPPQVLRRGVARLAALAGIPVPPVVVVTGREGASLLDSHRLACALPRQLPATVAVRLTGWPSLRRSGPAPAGEGWVVGTLSRGPDGLRLCSAAPPAAVDRAAAVLGALSPRLRRLTVHRSLPREPKVVYRRPADGAAHRLVRAYEGIRTGFRIDSLEQAMVKDRGASATYGELTLDGVARIFSQVSVNGRSFLDMGSGVGRAVLGAALGFPVARSVGVELSPSRSRAAREALANLRAQTGRPWPHVQLIEADMLAFDTSGFDVIFISNLCFGEAFNKRLGAKFDRELRPGTHVFSSKDVAGARSTRHPKLPVVAMSWNPRSSLFYNVW